MSRVSRFFPQQWMTSGLAEHDFATLSMFNPTPNLTKKPSECKASPQN
jgi:hypothetical protein